MICVDSQWQTGLVYLYLYLYWLYTCIVHVGLCVVTDVEVSSHVTLRNVSVLAVSLYAESNCIF